MSAHGAVEGENLTQHGPELLISAKQAQAELDKIISNWRQIYKDNYSGGGFGAVTTNVIVWIALCAGAEHVGPTGPQLSGSPRSVTRYVAVSMPNVPGFGV